ncbi:LIM domain-containing protein WLIM2b [Vitis vinifera]|uniref:LIM domain-containing protein WLIM2b n=1 Tax=Vitis vinifera TaxID=29760 RepID=A0A438FLF2_VITVI|nr:LIM domain-containing protein WLIM2b [Vitis vinifera]
MSFIGTQQKCKACLKTVYPVEQLSADGVVYHKSCFKCSHCNGTLKLSNYSSMEGVLYCKPHFEQLFKESGNFNKNFQSPAKSAEKLTPELTRSPSKAASMFSGTQEKCATCGKTAYPLEKCSLYEELSTSANIQKWFCHGKPGIITVVLGPSAWLKIWFKVESVVLRSNSQKTNVIHQKEVTVESQAYHKSCFKCSHGGCPISPSNYAALEGILYCKHHFAQLFKEKGSYNHLIKSASMKRSAASVPDA